MLIAVVVKNPSDFVGSVLGETEKNTKAILNATVGKVLVIDEASANRTRPLHPRSLLPQAYGLYGGGAKGGNASATSDPFKTAVIDTIVAEVQSVPGEDRCVLLLGYEEQMVEMFNVSELTNLQNHADVATERQPRFGPAVRDRECFPI